MKPYYSREEFDALRSAIPVVAAQFADYEDYCAQAEDRTSSYAWKNEQHRLLCLARLRYDLRYEKDGNPT